MHELEVIAAENGCVRSANTVVNDIKHVSTAISAYLRPTGHSDAVYNTVWTIAVQRYNLDNRNLRLADIQYNTMYAHVNVRRAVGTAATAAED